MNDVINSIKLKVVPNICGNTFPWVAVSVHNIQRNYMVAKALQMSAKMGADEAVSTGH